MAARPDDPVLAYVDYLDKEMTIMGVLSAFTVAGAAFTLDRILGASDAPLLAELWKRSGSLFLLGAGSLLVAALCFYRQRSLLAYYYGQILLSRTALDYMQDRTLSILEDADAWHTWRHYQNGFAFLSAAFAYWFMAILPSTFLAQPGVSRWLVWVLPLTIAVLVAATQAIVMTMYKYNDAPWSDWLHRRPRTQATVKRAT